MKVQVKYNLIALLAVFLVFICFLVGAGMPAVVAGAASIDYVDLEYVSISDGVDYKSENVVVRFHCPSIRHIGDEEGYIEGFEDYVSYISFRQSIGNQIYFVNGVACNLEDGDNGDNSTTIYDEYYDIKYYDAENQYVYITFKDLDELVASDIAAYENGVAILVNSDETYTERAKLAYLPSDGTAEGPADGSTEGPATGGNLEDNSFKLEWWHILMGLSVLTGIAVASIWSYKKSK